MFLRHTGGRGDAELQVKRGQNADVELLNERAPRDYRSRLRCGRSPLIIHHGEQGTVGPGLDTDRRNELTRRVPARRARRGPTGHKSCGMRCVRSHTVLRILWKHRPRSLRGTHAAIWLCLPSGTAERARGDMESGIPITAREHQNDARLRADARLGAPTTVLACEPGFSETLAVAPLAKAIMMRMCHITSRDASIPTAISRRVRVPHALSYPHTRSVLATHRPASCA